MGRNASEAIVDKDNHARDACKYVVMSQPAPAHKTPHQLAAEEIRPLVEAGDLTSAYIRYLQKTANPANRPRTAEEYRAACARGWRF